MSGYAVTQPQRAFAPRWTRAVSLLADALRVFDMPVGSDVQEWATAISTNADNGRRIVFRYARQFHPSFDRASQPVRIILAWNYESESGQPEAAWARNAAKVRWERHSCFSEVFCGWRNDAAEHPTHHQCN
jgi:hypothetical protein